MSHWGEFQKGLFGYHIFPKNTGDWKSDTQMFYAGLTKVSRIHKVDPADRGGDPSLRKA
jgi:hypothetical protein